MLLSGASSGEMRPPPCATLGSRRRRDLGAAVAGIQRATLVCELGEPPPPSGSKGRAEEEEEGPPGASSGETRLPPRATFGSCRRRDLGFAVAGIQGATPVCELGEPPPPSGSKGRMEEGPKREELAGGGGLVQRSGGGAGRANERWKRMALLFLRCVVGEVNFCMSNFSPVRDQSPLSRFLFFLLCLCGVFFSSSFLFLFISLSMQLYFLFLFMIFLVPWLF